MDLLTGKGPSKRHEIYYVTERALGAIRIDDFKYRFTDQPNGWFGATENLDMTVITNLRLDPSERTGMSNGRTGSWAYYNWFVFEFWRWVFVNDKIKKELATFIEFPPQRVSTKAQMGAILEKIKEKMATEGQ